MASVNVLDVLITELGEGGAAGLLGALLLLLASVFVNVHLVVNGILRWLAYLLGGYVVGSVLGRYAQMEFLQCWAAGASWPYLVLFLWTLGPILRNAMAEALAGGGSP